MNMVYSSSLMMTWAQRLEQFWFHLTYIRLTCSRFFVGEFESVLSNVSHCLMHICIRHLILSVAANQKVVCTCQVPWSVAKEQHYNIAAWWTYRRSEQLVKIHSYIVKISSESINSYASTMGFIGSVGCNMRRLKEKSPVGNRRTIDRCSALWAALCSNRYFRRARPLPKRRCDLNRMILINIETGR